MDPDEATDEVLAPDVEENDQTEAEDADEASDEEQAEPQEGDESEPGGDSEPAYTVTIDGEERKLSRSDIEKGIMLHRAFTQKTQGLAEEKRQWDAAVAQVRQSLSREVESVKGWLEFYQANQPQEPDWAAIAEKNPADWVRQKAKWDADAGKRAQARQHYEAIVKQENEQRQERFVSELYTEFPAWQDKATMMREVGEIYTAAAHYGFSQDDVNQMMDPKAFKVLKDAAAYRALQNKKTEVQARVTEAPRKPPVRGPSVKLSALDQKIADAVKLAKGGNLEAAAEVMRLRQMKAQKHGTTH
ncbi:MAG: hypothetical protein ACRCUC_13055 [Aestuariivirga sp.]